MYQAIYYDFSDYKYYLRDDKEGWNKKFSYSPTYYVEHYAGQYLTLDGRKVAPVKKLENYRDPKYFEKDVDKVTRLLVDLYHEEDDPPEHNIVYLDIECEIGGALTPENIKAASTQVTAVALYDNNSKKYTCFVLGDSYQTEEDNKEVLSYIKEEELLEAFLDKWEELDATVISGWNSIYFDIHDED